MFLKRLEMFGFKSFAERVTIDFVPGVTAVVGPNGSGKSNVIDAVRWVLGEQSAKSLRGGKMEDIIFAGSDSRRPLNFAEVAITLDNEDHFLPIDYNEVCIMRRLYRSGESEYFINKQPCRLRDIVDLLMDSGLGRDSFSIISQGKVEEILNSKPEERRTIFEEAAGVLKYKTRKKKAEVKLQETEENLNRVQDILYELESQIEPLRIQSSLAKDYLEKKEELEHYEIRLLVYEIGELHSKWETLKDQLKQMKDHDIKLSATIQAKEAEIESLRDKSQALDESIEQLQQVLLVTSEDLKKIEGQKEVLKERKKNAAKNREQLEIAIKDGKQKLVKNEKEVNELTQLHVKLRTVITEEKEKLQEKQKTLAYYSEDIEEKIESLKSDYIELLSQQATYKNDALHLGQQLNQLKKKREQLVLENEKYIKERDGIVRQKEKLTKELRDVEQALAQCIKQYREEERKLEQMQNQYEKEEKVYYQALQYLQQAKQREELLAEMQEDYAGFYQGVKEILKQRESLPGIEGAVAEIIHVDQKYAVAIDTTLGSSQQYIVVQKEEHAREAIKYLKNHSFGRATFLPMDVIQERTIPAHLLTQIQNHPSFVGLANDLISYDPKYKNVVTHLLGAVVISKDLQGANSIARILNHRYRIVTLDGDIVNPGGSMTGGASKKKANSLLNRKQELETLQLKIGEMEEKCERLERSLKNKKQAYHIQVEKVQSLREKGELLRQDERGLKDQLKEINWNENNLNEKLSLYDSEDRAYKNEVAQIEHQNLMNEKEIEQIQIKVQEIDQMIHELSNKRNIDMSKKTEIVEEINELKVSLAKKEENLKNCESQLTALKNRQAEIKQSLTNNEKELALLVAEMESNFSGASQLEREAEQKLYDKKQTLELIAERRKQRHEFQQTLEDLEQDLKELKRQYNYFQQTLKEEEVKLNRLDVELDNHLTTLREEYMLTYEGARSEYPLTIPYEEAKKKVKLIKLAIDELGTVNLGAIDEFERVSERFKFLSEQKADLQQAKETLYQVIEEMDEEMIKRFTETFTAIKAEFDNVFQSLFGGGKAELQLTDPTDLLNTGIEIIAQPPGKKLQNLHLLSGGERALTAIALLFSIIKTRPVPFCILDEVEAALDEANVYRFSQYLKHFSKETQFIVITHRKGTMEEADVLYGVTMQESGVSKLVSVRLEDAASVV